jgi:hypothetical protein
LQIKKHGIANQSKQNCDQQKANREMECFRNAH